MFRERCFPTHHRSLEPYITALVRESVALAVSPVRAPMVGTQPSARGEVARIHECVYVTVGFEDRLYG